jgi:hypothetical protein
LPERNFVEQPVRRPDMPIDISSMNDGVVFAKTRDGLALPVIDVSRPPFAIPDDPASLAAYRDTFREWHRRQRLLPGFVTRLVRRFAARRSRLVRAVFQSHDGGLDGITTYIMKLGADHLPEGFDGFIDRRVASAPHGLLLRLRMQQIAKSLARALSEPLMRDPAAPLHLINIAGGPALDTINALIMLGVSRPDLVKRNIAIHVLDSEAEGPAFGANALTALQAPGRPLYGIDIAFQHRLYDWNDTAPLRALLQETRGAVVAAASEGGLFEYGSDDAIVSNLATLRNGGVDCVAGSVTSSSETRKQLIAITQFKLRPRGLKGFRPLADRAGYRIITSEPADLSDQVTLKIA